MPIPKNPANQTPPQIVEKVLHLRSKYHLGSIRIVWYLARYHGIKISDAQVMRILRRNGVGRLPRRTRLYKVHSKRYNKPAPGRHSGWMRSFSPSQQAGSPGGNTSDRARWQIG